MNFSAFIESLKTVQLDVINALAIIIRLRDSAWKKMSVKSCKNTLGCLCNISYYWSYSFSSVNRNNEIFNRWIFSGVRLSSRLWKIFVANCQLYWRKRKLKNWRQFDNFKKRGGDYLWSGIITGFWVFVLLVVFRVQSLQMIRGLSRRRNIIFKKTQKFDLRY